MPVDPAGLKEAETFTKFHATCGGAQQERAIADYLQDPGSDWARCAPRDRARILRRWADLIDADVKTLAQIEAVGSTRPVKDVASWDVPFTADGIRFFAEWADKIGGDIAPTRTDHLGMTIAEPYGVIAAIAPWNLPLVMASWKVAPALGGKSPQLVFADVPDLEKTARTVARAIMINAGQVCVAGSRLIVQRAISGRFVESLSAIFAELKAGNTWNADTSLCPIISKREMERIDGIVQRTVADGGQLRRSARIDRDRWRVLPADHPYQC